MGYFYSHIWSHWWREINFRVHVTATNILQREGSEIVKEREREDEGCKFLKPNFIETAFSAAEDFDTKRRARNEA